MYIHEHENWWQFRFDNEKLLDKLAAVRAKQGFLLGKMSSIGFSLQNEAVLETLTLDVLKSSEIEGEMLNLQQVRSSIAVRLGIEMAGISPSSHYVDGVVEMMLDATQNYQKPLTHERLFAWHGTLFPSGRSGLYAIDVARYRTHEMQVVSGAMGRERVHYQAPAPERISAEMETFLAWINDDSAQHDLVLKAAIAHFWFVTIHPFDDGNGRIARSITDMILAKSDQTNRRFYSLSNEILLQRKNYYAILEKTQHGNGDITEWLEWFINCFEAALNRTEKTLVSVLAKANFWELHRETPLNDRQRKLINRLFDGFEGKLSSGKWAKIAKCSRDTALHDLADLVAKNILQKNPESGRSTNYVLKDF